MTREELERRVAALEFVLGEALAALLTGPQGEEAFDKQKRLVDAVNGATVEARRLLDPMIDAHTAMNITAALRSSARNTTTD